MSNNLFNKVLNFVGWEAVQETDEEKEYEKFEPQQEYISSVPQVKKPQNKVVNLHQNGQFKVIIIQPENIDDAQEISDHLKNNKTVVINLESIGKDEARRIVDFLSGTIYALDGSIQKVSYGIFVITPNNVDLMGEFKDELKNKGVLPWLK